MFLRGSEKAPLAICIGSCLSAVTAIPPTAKACGLPCGLLSEVPRGDLRVADGLSSSIGENPHDQDDGGDKRDHSKHYEDAHGHPC